MSKPPVVALLVFLLANVAASAEPEVSAAPTWEKALKNDWYEISFDLRARMELADLDGADRSRANTFRTLLGLRTKPRYGLSGFVQLENNTAINNDRYFDTIHESNGKTAIADPRHTSINQAYGRYQSEELWGLDLTAGRQMIVLDDSRFIGNVGWRQNMQTFDSARAASNLGVVGLRATFAYLWEVLRIFGDQGPPANRDFDSDSSVFHVSNDTPLWCTFRTTSSAGSMRASSPTFSTSTTLHAAHPTPTGSALSGITRSTGTGPSFGSLPTPIRPTPTTTP